jgi:hypothetical protein
MGKGDGSILTLYVSSGPAGTSQSGGHSNFPGGFFSTIFIFFKNKQPSHSMAQAYGKQSQGSYAFNYL